MNKATKILLAKSSIKTIKQAIQELKRISSFDLQELSDGKFLVADKLSKQEAELMINLHQMDIFVNYFSRTANVERPLPFSQVFSKSELIEFVKNMKVNKL
jgi:hypothetical protein